MTKGYLLAFTFVVAAVPAAWCEKRFILEAPPAEVSRVATQNGLTVVRPVKANVPAYVVSAPDAVSDSNWEDRVRSDPSVDTFERNSTSGIPEGRPRPAPLYAVSGALQS